MSTVLYAPRKVFSKLNFGWSGYNPNICIGYIVDVVELDYKLEKTIYVANEGGEKAVSVIAHFADRAGIEENVSLQKEIQFESSKSYFTDYEKCKKQVEQLNERLYIDFANSETTPINQNVIQFKEITEKEQEYADFVIEEIYLN